MLTVRIMCGRYDGVKNNKILKEKKMFRNRKISFIVGACIGALILIFQAIPPFRDIGPSFAANDRPGLGLIHVAWIFLIISADIVLALGLVGAFVMMRDRFSKHVNIYGIFYNVSLFLPFIFCLLILLGDAMSVFAFMEQSVPDAFAEVFILNVPGFYVAFFITLAMPIASHFKKIRKRKSV